MNNKIETSSKNTKVQKEIKLLIRGGSISAGKGVEKSYADLLKNFSALKNWEIINRSRERDNTFDGIWSFQTDIAPFSPDVFIIHFGVDDAYFPVYRSEFKENLVQMVRLSRELFNPHIILLTSQPFENQYDSEVMDIYYRTIREVAVDLDCEMIPMHTYFWGYLEVSNLNLRDLVQEDCRYPNNKGHEIFAEAIALRLERFSK